MQDQVGMIGKAMSLYSTDADLTLPPHDGDLKARLMPYIIRSDGRTVSGQAFDEGLFDHLTYIGAHDKESDIQKPSEYILAYVKDESGTFAIYADGHVQPWVGTGVPSNP